MATTETVRAGAKHQFGAFGGVFTPSILTIFGLIMFMRANYVVGNAGVLQSLLILALACGITFLTGLSIAAISSNTPVKGGGAYFLISRVLGPGFGTAIGIALFLAQALSVPFYILGFVEALTDTKQIAEIFPNIKDYYLMITLAVLVVLFALAWIGAKWVIKVQYVILGLLACAIVVFLVGAGQRFELTRFWINLDSRYTEGNNLWTMFAIYFPAVTGIMAGVNMSGDLKNPAKALPLGTLAAIVLSYFVYSIQIILCGGMATHQQLVDEPYLLLVRHAIFGLGWLVAAGVFCATISSAIGSNLGAPRVLQAVGRDGVLKLLTPFGKGTAKGDEPRRALILTFFISFVTLLFAGRFGRQGLNMVAGVVTMVFLYTYGMTNLAAFVESRGANPSFRPRFRYFHWLTALVGGVACVWAAFMINPLAAALALLFIFGLFHIVRSKEMSAAYGDARRGFIYSQVSNSLLKLAAMPAHPKNWRPTILVLSSRPHQHLALIGYARWLGQQSGIVSLVYVLEGSLDELQVQRQQEELRLARLVTDNDLSIFPEVIVMNDFDREFNVFLQAYSIGPIKPNVVLLGWPQKEERLAPYYEHVRTIQKLGKSLVIFIDHGTPVVSREKRIDCWWRGQRNGSLMVVLAHLLMLNSEWSRTKLRLLRQVNLEDKVSDARAELENIVSAARITAEICIPVSQKPFPEVLRQHSADATLILLGLSPPRPDFQEAAHENTEIMLDNMPSTMLVYSSGDADLQA